jgi:methionyl-tRNA formyltransferase
MKILFMGTPDFAVFTLKALVERGENVIGVVTQTDKPRGRGYELLPTPVKVYAQEHNIPVYQPKTLRGEEFADQLKDAHIEYVNITARCNMGFSYYNTKVGKKYPGLGDRDPLR